MSGLMVVRRGCGAIQRRASEILQILSFIIMWHLGEEFACFHANVPSCRLVPDDFKYSFDNDIVKTSRYALMIERSLNIVGQ